MSKNPDEVSDLPPDLDDAPIETGPDTAPVASKPEIVADDPPDLDSNDDLDALMAEAEKAEPTRARDDAGRFAKQPLAPVAPVADQGATQQADRYAHWPTDHRAAYEKLAPDTRSLVDRHEKLLMDDVRQKVMPALDEAQPFMDVLTTPEMSTYLSRLSAETKHPPQAIVARVLETERTLRYGSMAEKRATLQAMIKDYGVDLNAPEHWMDDQAPAESHDLKQQLAEMKWQLQQINNAQQQASTSRAVDETTRFAATKDDQGQPKYPLYSVVRGAMADLLESGQAKTLAEAYAEAVKPIEGLYVKKTAAPPTVTRERAREAVERAGRTRPIRGSMGPQTVSAPDLDEIIRSSMEAA
jgi:hypothetical protein